MDNVLFSKLKSFSGKGRWFKNADVVTTIIVLEKKESSNRPDTEFWLWKFSLDQLSEDIDAENTLINAALLSSELDHNISAISFCLFGYKCE